MKGSKRQLSGSRRNGVTFMFWVGDLKKKIEYGDGKTPASGTRNFKEGVF